MTKKIRRIINIVHTDKHRQTKGTSFKSFQDINKLCEPVLNATKWVNKGSHIYQ